MYTILISNKPSGILQDRAQAIDTARQYLLTHDNVIVKDKTWNTIYRHAKPKTIAGEPYAIKR